MKVKLLKRIRKLFYIEVRNDTYKVFGIYGGERGWARGHFYTTFKLKNAIHHRNDAIVEYAKAKYWKPKRII